MQPCTEPPNKRTQADGLHYMYIRGVDAYSTVMYERIATIIATNHAGTTVFRWNPIPNWRKLPSSLYMNRGFKACTAANAAKNTRMETDVMCRLMK